MRKISFIGVFLLSALSAGAQTYLPSEGNIRFAVYQSTSSYTQKQILTTPFTHHYTSILKSIDLDAAKPSHEYLGLGVSMTDASCWLIDALGSYKGGQLLSDAFGQDGLGLSMMRLNCGSSDYATSLYCYNDCVDDVKMKHFSIDRDKIYMIPVIKKALALRDDFFVFSSIWSAPGWMKDSGHMCGGKLLDEYMPAFAAYWAAYLKAYKEAGIDIDAITVQNEPLTDQRGANPATLISGPQEAALAGRYLPEAFRKNKVDAQIWIHDHDYNFKYGFYERLLDVLSDPDVRKNIGAVAFHPYGGTPVMMDSVRAHFPGIPFHLTERGMNLRERDTQTEKWCADLVFGALNHGCSSYTAWNLALDMDGQPLTGCFWCRGLFEVNLEEGTYSETPLCTLFRHIGPYVKRGAQILSIEQPDPNLATIAFLNPDGTRVVVVACDNPGPNRRRVQIKYKDEYFVLNMPLYKWSLSTVVIEE